MYSSKQYISFNIQYYLNYNLNNQAGFKLQEEDITDRPDLRTISFGLQYLYAINYTKFSLKAPFVLNEIQKKSAGSPIVGANFSLYVLNADSSLIPKSGVDVFDSRTRISDFSNMSFGINVGYMYSFIFKKHFFLTLSAIPGIHLNMGDYSTGERTITETSINAQFIAMNSIGYNGERVYTGFQYINNSFFLI